MAYRARQRVYCEPRASGKDRAYTSLPDVARAFARKRLGLDLDGAPAGATCWNISARACCLCCMMLNLGIERLTGNHIWVIQHFLRASVLLLHMPCFCLSCNSQAVLCKYLLFVYH